MTNSELLVEYLPAAFFCAVVALFSLGVLVGRVVVK